MSFASKKIRRPKINLVPTGPQMNRNQGCAKPMLFSTAGLKKKKQVAGFLRSTRAASIFERVRRKDLGCLVFLLLQCGKRVSERGHFVLGHLGRHIWGVEEVKPGLAFQIWSSSNAPFN